jgi:hypothetical protein
MSKKRIAEDILKRGNAFPYDAPDTWWNGDGKCPPPAKHWAHAAARGVLADLKDRRGIKHAFTEIDERTRREIVGDLARIILAAAP